MYIILASLCAGLAVGCFFLLLADLLGRVEVDSIQTNEGEDPRRLPLIFRIFLPLSSNVSFFRRDSFSSIRKSTLELLQKAGVDQLMTPEQYLGVKFLMILAGFLLLVLMSFAGQNLYGFLLLVLLALYPDNWLKKNARRRNLSVLKSLPNLLDLL